MKKIGALTLTTPTDREIVLTRAFDAPRKLVFEAMTKPELVKRWLAGPPGWVMTVCTIDLRVGGAFRYEWKNDAAGTAMGMGGVYKEIKAPEKVVATEKFDEAWYPGDAVGTILLTEQGGKTTMTQTILYASKEARDLVLKTPMEQGVAASYDRLEQLLPTMRAA